jgi:hypothetical protein
MGRGTTCEESGPRAASFQESSVKLEEKIMADRERKDFVKVRPRAGCGAVNIVDGPFALRLAAGESKEITRAEWVAVYEPTGALELIEETAAPQRSQRTQREE